jgi:hypothetical protein
MLHAPRCGIFTTLPRLLSRPWSLDSQVLVTALKQMTHRPDFRPYRLPHRTGSSWRALTLQDVFRLLSAARGSRIDKAGSARKSNRQGRWIDEARRLLRSKPSFGQSSSKMQPHRSCPTTRTCRSNYEKAPSPRCSRSCWVCCQPRRLRLASWNHC